MKQTFLFLLCFVLSLPALPDVFSVDFTGGTNNADVPGWTNTNAGDKLTYNEISGVTYLDSSNNGLNYSYMNFSGFDSGVTSFTMEYVIRSSAAEMQFGLGSQSIGPNFLIGLQIKNTDLRLIRPNSAGTAFELDSSVQDPANNTLVSVRLEVDVSNDLVDVYYNSGSGGATTQVANDLDLKWSGLVTDTASINRYSAATRTSTGLRDVTVTTIPEPSAVFMVMMGFLSLLLIRRKS